MNDQNGATSFIKTIIREARDSIKEIIKEKAPRLMSIAEEEVADRLKQKIGDLLENISYDTLIQLIKLAWNFEEKYQENYGLEDAIKWFKSNHPGKQYLACILMSVKLEITKLKEIPDMISLHHCFIETETNNPVLDGSLPYRVVKTLTLKDDLKNAFGNKDMIILR